MPVNLVSLNIVGPNPGEWARLAGCVVFCNAVGSLGALSTSEAVRTWYPTLREPALSPPPWVFGPVWTLLYTLMGVALWLLWRRRGGARSLQRTALAWFAFQLTLNAAWSPVFFGAQNLGLALVVIVAMLAAIALTMWAARPVHPAVPWLLAPYLAWVAFATYLNAGYWALNR